MAELALAQIQRCDANGELPRLALESIPVPTPAAHELLVKITHAGQNPTDIQSFDSNAFGDGAVLGCDFVGTVIKTGRNVTLASEADTVSGLVWGGETEGVGAYSQYSLANEKICFRVPHSISPAEAATVPLASTTAWLALFSKITLHMNRTARKDTVVLVWGGSSSVGHYAIQFASLHGFRVITTCSPRHFDKVKSLGANHAFDYRATDVVESIRTVAPDLAHVFDTIGSKQSSATASHAVSDRGILCTVRPGKENTADVTERTKVTDILVWTAFLKDHKFGELFWPASQDDHQLATELFQRLSDWLDKGTIKTSTPKILTGLKAIPEGFKEYRDGKISGYKIVYAIDG